MKCSLCKNYDPYLTKVEGKLFCDQCKPDPMKLEFEAASVKQEIDPMSDSSDSSSSRCSLQMKLKTEIHIKEDDETVDSINYSLDMSYSPEEIDNNGVESKISETVVIVNSTKLKPKAKKLKTANKKDKELKCHLCDYRCNTMISIKNHRKKFHPELGTFRCKICYRECNGVLMLDKHIDEEHGGFGAKCKFCLEKLKRDQRLTHQRECEGRHLFSCGTCEKKYVKLESLRNHLDEHSIAEAHKDLSIVRTRTRERLFICVICDEGLVSEEEPYWKHVKEQHDGHHLRCEDCGKTYKNSNGLSTHKFRYCKVGRVRERFIPEEILCPHCSKSYKNKASLAAHIHNMHRKTPLSCSKCGMKLQATVAYRFHKVGKFFFCDQCKPHPTKLEIDATPIKQETDTRSDDSSDSSSSRYSLQMKLKTEIDINLD